MLFLDFVFGGEGIWLREFSLLALGRG